MCHAILWCITQAWGEIVASKRGNSEGYIRQRSDGRWEGQYVAGRKADGSIIRRSVYGITQAEVSQKLLEVRQQQTTGQYVQPDKMTVGQWLETWLETYVKPTRRPATAVSYANIIKSHLTPILGRVVLQKLRPENVQAMCNAMKDKGLKPATVTKARNVLKAAMKQAIINRLIVNDPCEGATPPKMEQEEIKYLSLEEQRRFVAALPDTTYGRALGFILGTGLRIAELCGLRWRDVKGNTITVSQTIRRLQTLKEGDGPKTELVTTKPKTKAGLRTIPLPPKLQASLKREKQEQAKMLLLLGVPKWESDLVFCTETGKPLEVRNVNRALYKILDELGIEQMGVHALRHTFATRAIDNGMDPKTLSEILGHADVATTMRLYVHSSMDTKQKSMNAMNDLL